MAPLTPLKTIIVTGFGPFGLLKVNDSWECVKKLKELNIEDELGVSLIIKELPVIYAVCEKEVPLLWEEYNPELVIHVGFGFLLDMVSLETAAKKTGYFSSDITNSLPSEATCPLGTEDNISTHVDLNRILKFVDSKGFDIIISNDAGSYLCEYTYYLSLCQDPKRTFFIHIPATETEARREDLAIMLKNIVIEAYRQLHLS